MARHERQDFCRRLLPPEFQDGKAALIPLNSFLIICQIFFSAQKSHKIKYFSDRELNRFLSNEALFSHS